MSSVRSVLTAAYAVSASKCPASMLNTFMNGVIAGGVTSVQVLPPSVVVWIMPSSVPTQRRSALIGDGAIA